MHAMYIAVDGDWKRMAQLDNIWSGYNTYKNNANEAMKAGAQIFQFPIEQDLSKVWFISQQYGYRL